MAFFISAFAVTAGLLLSAVPTIDIYGPGRDAAPLYPAPPGYLLPWAGGEIHDVTQGEETTFTHNGLAAYAFDFDLNYDTVVAARSGKVVSIREDSNRGGCNPIYASWTNYVVIDHGDGTSGAYLHLAYDAVMVEPGQEVAQGQPIAVSGETGVTCSDAEDAPGPHLHFQVQRFDEGHYFSQSLPLAFDDIGDNEGVPVAGRGYVSGNFGRGQPQKIKLTPYRVAREFNPIARPAFPGLVEAPAAPPPPRGDAPAPAPTATETPRPLIETQLTPEPTATEEPPTETATPPAEDTPTVAPLPSNTPAPPPPPATATPVAPSATPIAEPSPAAPPATETPTAEAASTETPAA